MIIFHFWYCFLHIIILLIEILGMCYCNILFFTNTLQLTFQLIFSSQDFYILISFIINDPDVFWYLWFKFMDLLFGFPFFNLCTKLYCNCINFPLQLIHFINFNVFLWRFGLCLNLQICHTTLISFISFIRRAVSYFCWSFVALRLSDLTWLVLWYSTELCMAVTNLSLSATTRSSSSSSTTFASFVWHQVISIFVEMIINEVLNLIPGSFYILRIFTSLKEILVIGCYWCLICT